MLRTAWGVNTVNILNILFVLYSTCLMMTAFIYVMLYPNTGEQAAWSVYPFIGAEDRCQNKYISKDSRYEQGSWFTHSNFSKLVKFAPHVRLSFKNKYNVIPGNPASFRFYFLGQNNKQTVMLICILLFQSEFHLLFMSRYFWKFFHFSRLN